MQAARVLRGGAWPERFAVRRSDEIGLLQTVFNEMTTALQQSQEQLLGLIDTDTLSGLDNHRRFQERLAQETARSAASPPGYMPAYHVSSWSSGKGARPDTETAATTRSPRTAAHAKE